MFGLAFYKLVTIYNNLYPQASFNGSTKNLPATFQVLAMRIYFHDGFGDELSAKDDFILFLNANCGTPSLFLQIRIHEKTQNNIWVKQVDS